MNVEQQQSSQTTAPVTREAPPNIKVVISDVPGFGTLGLSLRTTPVEPRYYTAHASDKAVETVATVEPQVFRITVEELVAQVIGGLTKANKGPFKSRPQAIAITKLEEALHWLRERPNHSDKKEEGERK